jgi:spermidine/putrescine transport system ATP-binding protein
MTPAVEARETTKVFGHGDTATRALDDVSVAIRPGEFFTLLGPSGCGKTTLLRLVAGFETPSAGAILLEGRDVTAEPPNRRPVNTVFQSYALFPHMTVAGNIGFGLEMQGRPREDVAARVAEMLELTRMRDFADRRTGQLSGGQQQRVALARALAPAPRVLLLDEPLSALDLKLRKEMQRELKRLQHETGITFVFVTHDQEEALTMSDRIGVMQAGRILQVGTPREIYTAPTSRFVADFIGETNFLTGRARDGVVILDGGGEVVAEGTGSGSVTLAVRPEHVHLEDGGLQATVVSSMYFGTDVGVDLRLDGGQTLTARLPMPPDGTTALEPGAAARVGFAPGALKPVAE